MALPAGTVSGGDDSAEPFDSAEYSRQVGVSIEEANRRLDLQPEIGELDAALEASEAETFAGLYVEHSPTFRVIAQFTEGGDSALARRGLEADLAPFVVVRDAKYTLQFLVEEQKQIYAALGDGAYNMFVDVAANRVIIEAMSTDEVSRLAGEKGVSLPDSAVVRAVPELPRPAVNLYGGLGLTGCTSGFTIYYLGSTTNRGITTAGHCSNSQSYSGNSLQYQSDELFSGSYDEQSHKLAGQPYTSYRNWVYDGIAGGSTPYYRTITARTYRANQGVGLFVCKFGKTTGYGCGFITTKTDMGCAPLKAPTYIHVDSDPNGTGYDLAEGGDSGGPFFSNYIALGTLSCQQGFDAIYAALDYVEGGLNANVLITP